MKELKKKMENSDIEFFPVPMHAERPTFDACKNDRISANLELIHTEKSDVTQ